MKIAAALLLFAVSLGYGNAANAQPMMRQSRAIASYYAGSWSCRSSFGNTEPRRYTVRGGVMTSRYGAKPQPGNYETFASAGNLITYANYWGGRLSESGTSGPLMGANLRIRTTGYDASSRRPMVRNVAFTRVTPNRYTWSSQFVSGARGHAPASMSSVCTRVSR